MIKNRSFMLGMGAGLIVGALLLQLAIIGQGQTQQSASKSTDLTREQVETAANRMNLQVTDTTDKLMTEEDWRNKVIQEGSKHPKVPEKAETAKKPAVPKTPVNAPASNASKPSEGKKLSSTLSQDAGTGGSSVTPPKEPIVPEIQYRITAGSNLENVAKGLAQAGVVSDSGAFKQAAIDKKINTKIRTGSYNFTKGEDFSSIIKKITTKPSK